jgi:hypothetical protein
MTAPIDLESLRRITAAFDLAINRCDLWPSERTQIREAARYWKAALAEHDAQPAPAPVQEVACDAAAVERALAYLAFQEDGAQWPDAYSKDEQDMEREKMRGVLAAANSTSGPGAYCRACQSVGMSNCQHFDECSGATCITCHRPLNAHPPAPAADGAGELLSMIDDVAADLTDHKSLAYEKLRKVRAAIAALRQPVPDAVRELPGKWRQLADDNRHYAAQDNEIGRHDSAFALHKGADALETQAAELESALASQQESRK